MSAHYRVSSSALVRRGTGRMRNRDRPDRDRLDRDRLEPDWPDRDRPMRGPGTGALAAVRDLSLTQP
ncbi:hypothetical protein Sm713_55810 [Streptomyces sp. TS71-3]|nr:hypothetical protein Sm713_55810 [Streptomyces sp. TS71-3]